MGLLGRFLLFALGMHDGVDTPRVIAKHSCRNAVTCATYRPCCCRRAADGHCWGCGFQEDQHPRGISSVKRSVK